jgi:hypothetical protein
LKNPEFVSADATDKPARPASFDITRDDAAFRRLVRIAILGFLQDVAARDWEAARVRLLSENAPATDEMVNLAETRRLEKAFAPYFEARTRFRLDPEGRSAKHTHFLTDDSKSWSIAQVMADIEEQNDWEARFTVSLDKSRAENRAVVEFIEVKPIGA